MACAAGALSRKRVAIKTAKKTGLTCLFIESPLRQNSVGSSVALKSGHKRPKIWPHSA
jgi:hypothetical protein